MSLTPQDGITRTAQLHEITELSSLNIVTDLDEYLFFSLSNSMGIGIDQNTELEIESFLQRPFPPKKESPDYEPSESRITLVLKRGSIAIAADKISTLSIITVRIPNGEIRLYPSSFHLGYYETGTHIAVKTGNIAFSNADSKERRFITASEFIRISDQSAMLDEVAEIGDIETAMDERSSLMIDAAVHASERVVFKSGGKSGEMPYPIFIARPEYFEQPSSRPYQFLD
ncbi:MAG: hypothetical protein AAF065_06710 [Verrucomicrobiota bacterium]